MILKYLSRYLCQISLLIMLLPRVVPISLDYTIYPLAKHVTPCKGIWIPESRKFASWNVEYRSFASGNYPESMAMESRIQLKETGIQIPLTKNPESRT